MANYEIGFGKPPKGKPFKPGQSGNPRGRPPRAPNPLGEIVEEVLDGSMSFREKGEAKTASRREIAIRVQIERALKGEIEAADLLLRKRAHAVKHGEKDTRRLTVVNWLPDFVGQTAEQKLQDLHRQGVVPSGSQSQIETGDQEAHRSKKDGPPEAGEA